jgi:hypothetical protein
MKTSKKTKYLIAVLTALVGLSLQQAQAHLLAPTQFTLASPLGSPTDENTYLQNQGFLPGTSQFLFKANNDSTTDGTFGQYFTVDMVSGNSWDISWNLTGSGFTLDGVLIKDGVESPGHQLYRFYGVSADETLIGSGTVTFDDPIKGISHVSFFGSPGGSQVPDGGTTAALLGLALTGLAGLRAKFGRH